MDGSHLGKKMSEAASSGGQGGASSSIPSAYRDFFDASDDDEAKESAKDGGGYNKDHFPSILHFLLTELEKDGMNHIVSWQPHGRCFRIHQKDEFVAKVLPK